MSTKVNPPAPGAKPAAPTPTAVKPTAATPMQQPMPTTPTRTASPMPQSMTATTPTTSCATVNTPTFCMTPTHQQIAQRAYERWIKRGRPQNTHLQDWFEAEMELKREMANKNQKM